MKVSSFALKASSSISSSLATLSMVESLFSSSGSPFSASSCCSSFRCSARRWPYSTRLTSRSKKVSVNIFSLFPERRRMRGTSMTCTVPWSSPTARSCRCVEDWNCIEVTAAEVMLTVIDGSCERSSRSQISILPSALPMKITAGREGDHAPHESRQAEKGEANRGEETPSFHKVKLQSPTERCTLGTKGERCRAVHGPEWPGITERTPLTKFSSPGPESCIVTNSPSSVTQNKRHGDMSSSGTSSIPNEQLSSPLPSGCCSDSLAVGPHPSFLEVFSSRNFSSCASAALRRSQKRI
mmetsp:Transcript_38479/g.88220  ORF Transcript_38479/g.88220 Transcript_38479/m.88220 type:complete len:297 (-) Transcript_38479:787-1677(-)